MHMLDYCYMRQGGIYVCMHFYNYASCYTYCHFVTNWHLHKKWYLPMITRQKFVSKFFVRECRCRAKDVRQNIVSESS